VDTFEALERSREEFERRLLLVGAGDWDRPTPCSEWDVRALANHVVGGCRRYTMLLHGASSNETDALRTLDHLGDDAAGAFAKSADEMTAAFREPGALGRTVHHPAGDRSGEMLLGMRIMDFTLHAWDLARAIGADEHLDAELVALLWAVLPAAVPELAASGYFKLPERDSPADAPLQERLLHLTGREP
jgi:uncharacterized protein (TIGR03086 family)